MHSIRLHIITTIILFALLLYYLRDYLRKMTSHSINILLADDDKDDCMFFKEALEELQLQTKLTTVHDGEQLMQLLTNKSNELFHVLFLDLNMPRKSGATCLQEIKRNKKLKSLPVIIFSTSHNEHIADLFYKNGAQYYICKPADFSQLKKVIYEALILITQGDNRLPLKEKFMLTGDSITIPDMK